MFRVLFLNSSAKVPERIMAVKMIFEMSPRWTDNSGWKRTAINKQIKRIKLFMVSLFCGIMDLIQTLYVIVCFYVSKPVFSCQKHNLKWLYLYCIYLISYKIAKKANPMKWICLYQKRYHRFWIHYQDVGYIAGINGSGLMISN